MWRCAKRERERDREPSSTKSGPFERFSNEVNQETWGGSFANDNPYIYLETNARFSVIYPSVQGREPAKMSWLPAIQSASQINLRLLCDFTAWSWDLWFIETVCPHNKAGFILCLTHSVIPDPLLLCGRMNCSTRLSCHVHRKAVVLAQFFPNSFLIYPCREAQRPWPNSKAIPWALFYLFLLVKWQ